MSGASWRAPDLDPYIDAHHEELGDIEFTPKVKEAEPLLPEPSPQLKKEGIECQRFGSQGWNRIRYKDVEKHLHAAPVFSTLKVNTELGGLPTQPSPWLSKQEGILGTITHGLLLQRRALAEALNSVRRKCPEASEELRKVLADDSAFKILSDHLLQYVCAHRSDVIEMRRKVFKCKNDVLTEAVRNIPPSSTHLFDEKLLFNLVKDNGGTTHVFTSGNKFSERKVMKNTFRKPTAPAQAPKCKQASWRTRLSAGTQATPTRASKRHLSGSYKSVNKRHDRSGKERKTQKSRKY